MQFENNYMEDYLNDKENENINNEIVFNINPKLKYSKIMKINPSNEYNYVTKYNVDNYKKNEENLNILKNESLRLRTPNMDKHIRERRAKSISFADISEFSNSKIEYFDNNKYNANKSYSVPSINNRKSNNNLTRNRSYSSLNGTTTLARKRSFRKPKILISSKEHIRRLKKMKSVSALTFKQNAEENKKIKRRYSIHSPPFQKSCLFDDDFFGDKFDESYSDLPPNTLYHELKKAHEKELLEKQLNNKNNKLEVVDEETIYYDSDSTLHNSSVCQTDDEENNYSLLNFLLKYIENSINGGNQESVTTIIEKEIKEKISGNVIEKEINEELYDNSFHSNNSQFLDEEFELYKQEELLESMFNDVVKNFYGYQSKFYYTILKLLSFLLYNGGKMKLGSQLLKYVLKDKLGINLSSSDESSLSSTGINHMNHLENEEMEFVTINEIKENKRHNKRRRKGYKTLNKIWMIIHNIVILLVLYKYLIGYSSNITNKSVSLNTSNVKTINMNNINSKNNYNSYDYNSNINNKEDNNNYIWLSSSSIPWITFNKYHVSENYFYQQKCFVDEYTKNKINTLDMIYNQEGKKDKLKKNNFNIDKQSKSTSAIINFTPWKSLLLLECILFSVQLGFQYFIMDEVVPFFKPASYTSVLFINQIINFFVQYKIVWKILYNDLCLYLFVLGVYTVFL